MEERLVVRTGARVIKSSRAPEATLRGGLGLFPIPDHNGDSDDY